MFADRLIEAIKLKDNPSVLGLDPKIDFIPSEILGKAFGKFGENLEGAAEAICEFNIRLIEALHGIVPAVKLQSAFYEAYGLYGIRAMIQTISEARRKGLLVICDAKRNDIGSTAEAYSAAYLGSSLVRNGKTFPVFDADALTVNPFLGYDGIRPFLEDCKRFGKGIFILVKTSNKTSGQLQDLVTSSGKTVYEILAELVEEWGSGLVGDNGYSSIGAVVGATYPEQAAALRSTMRHAFILVPGYGAQGGTAMDAICSFGNDGYGAIVNASRSIICAYMSEKWKYSQREDKLESAAIEEAQRMKEDIRTALASVRS